jgi:hypothetical protein
MRIVTLCLALLLAGCVRLALVENRPPAAVAGPDQSMFGGHEVTLNGAGSTDPEGDALTFVWTQTAGTKVTLVDGGPAIAHFEAPEVSRPTTLVFQLEASDGRMTNKATTSVTLNVKDPNNNSPIAKITAPDTVQSGAMIELDGTPSKDADGDSMTFVWSQLAPLAPGPEAALTNPDQAKAMFVAPIVTKDTLHTFKLAVSDGKGGRSFADRSITVKAMTSNRPPIANAGWPQNASSSSTVKLGGSATDPDGEAIAAYKWKQTAGPAVKLSSSTEAEPTFIAPKPAEAVTLSFSLVVTDARGQESSPSTVNVVVSSGVIAPVQFTKVVSLHAVTRNSIVIFFLTDLPVAASVDYGVASAVEQTTTETQAGTRHVITLTGLTPDTRYRYAVRAGAASSFGTFTTAFDYSTTPRPFSFAVVGDARGHGTWKTISNSILARDPRFIVQTGDNNDSWGSAKNWENYYTAGKELFANVPVYAAQGNHDTGSNYSVYNLAPQSSSSSDLYYAFVYGNAGFVAINTNGSSRTMTAWVKGALERLKGGPLFAFQHHPLYSCGSHGSSTSLQRTFQEMFEKNGVTTNYTGHDHALIVWKAINGVRYVVSGGGGAGLYSLSGCEGPYAQSKFGFMMVDVNGQSINETLYDQNGVQLYSSGSFKAFGPAPDFKNLGDLVVY